MAVTTRQKIRRGTAAEWTSANPTLGTGEFGLETDTGILKLGDGTTAWTSQTDVIGGNAGFVHLKGLVAPYHPLKVTTSSVLGGANRAEGVRVGIPKTGTLHDLAVYVATQSGNVDIGVYSTAAPRAKLYSSGSVACPAAGAWQIIGDPNLAVTRGQQLDFVIAADNNTVQFGRDAVSLAAAVGKLPANFVAADGAEPLLCWIATSAFPLPSSFDLSANTGDNRAYCIIGRIV